MLKSKRLRLIILGGIGAGVLIAMANGRISLIQNSSYRQFFAFATLPLLGDAKVTQTFTAEYPGLYRIDVYFVNREGGNGKLVFRLKETCKSRSDITVQVVNEVDIVDNEFHPFMFAPIQDSRGRKYCIVLETVKLNQDNELAVYVSRSDVYMPGAAEYQKSQYLEAVNRQQPFTATHFVWLPIIQNGGMRPFDIGFQLYYAGSVLPMATALLAQFSAHKPGVFGTPWFYVIIFTVYIVLLIIFVWLIFDSNISD